MEKILEQIRGVPGVSGVIIADKVDQRLWKLLPSRFDEAEIEKLEACVKDLADRLDADSSFTIRFSSGWLVAKTTDELLLVVLAKDDLKFETFNLVTKASLASLRSAGNSETRLEPQEEFDPQTARVLVSAVNLVTRHFIQILGAFKASGLLRKTKEQLLPAFPLLKHFSVDNNGNVSLIRGSEEHLNETVVDAIACWCFYFKEMVNIQTPVVGFDIKAVTANVEFELAPLGFYSSYRRAAAKTVRQQ